MSKSIFICSSSKGLQIANALQANLHDDYNTEVWNQGSFALGENLQTSIKVISKRTDYVIIVLTADVLAKQQDNSTLLPRDNVLFELGLFSGLLGQDRTFIVHEDNNELRLPDYISGIVCARYAACNNNYNVEMGPIAQQIRTAITRSAKKKANPMIDQVLKIMTHALTGSLDADARKMRAFVFRKEGKKLVCSHFWSPLPVSEEDGVCFDINQETEKQVAVVKAAVKRKAVGVSVSVLPNNLDGVEGEIDPDLCFILAAPILSPEGEVWGTVDFDASSKETEYILSRPIVRSTIFELGKLLYPLLTNKVLL